VSSATSFASSQYFFRSCVYPLDCVLAPAVINLAFFAFFVAGSARVVPSDRGRCKWRSQGGVWGFEAPLKNVKKIQKMKL